KMSAAFGWAPMAHVEGDRESRLAEAERRQRILSEVSRVLLDYVGPDEIEPLRRTVHEVTEATGTDWCAFALVQPDGKLKNVATYPPAPRQRELEKKLNDLLPPKPWDAGPAELNALVQRRPIVTEDISDEMLRTAVPGEEAFQAIKEIGLTSAIVAPMFDGVAPLGRLLLASTGSGRRYSKDDVDFVVSLAGRAALAVRNARLVAQIARERDRQILERAEAERRFAELRAVFDWDPNGIALFDAGGALRLASHRIEEIFGIPLRAMDRRSSERRVKRSEAVRNDLVTKARRQVERLGRLVEDLLDGSRLESRRLHLSSSDVEINALVDGVVADFRAQTRSHDIRFHRAGAPVLVEGDRERLEQVLVNLMTN